MIRRRSRDEQSAQSDAATMENDSSNSSEMLVSQTPHHGTEERSMPQRKKRRTILESLQTMSLKTSAVDSSDDEGNSSCATGGSLLHDDGKNYGDGESMGGSPEGEEGGVLLSDQEKVHRNIMYQLATGNTPTGPNRTSGEGGQRKDVVGDRIEQLIRQSRLRAAEAAQTTTDDFHVVGQRDMMDVEPLLSLSSMRIKRSHSLPRNFEGPAELRPPMDTIEVEIEATMDEDQTNSTHAEQSRTASVYSINHPSSMQ